MKYTHIRRLLHKGGFKYKVSQKRFVRTATSYRKRKKVLKKDKSNTDDQS